ncbi:MAG: hypothetical protein ACOYOK_03560, partial [Pseudobdellovibrionaceae bacterium]
MPQSLLPRCKAHFYISYFNSALLIAASIFLQSFAARAVEPNTIIDRTPASSSVGKKTVCSITINSDQEINAFKKNLSPDLWNFVELTTLKADGPSGSSGTSDEDSKKDWMKNACAAKPACDILLISGHFGGSFFGKS